MVCESMTGNMLCCKQSLLKDTFVPLPKPFQKDVPSVDMCYINIIYMYNIRHIKMSQTFIYLQCLQAHRPARKFTCNYDKPKWPLIDPYLIVVCIPGLIDFQ